MNNDVAYFNYKKKYKRDLDWYGKLKLIYHANESQITCTCVYVSHNSQRTMIKKK